MKCIDYVLPQWHCANLKRQYRSVWRTCFWLCVLSVRLRIIRYTRSVVNEKHHHLTSRQKAQNQKISNISWRKREFDWSHVWQLRGTCRGEAPQRKESMEISMLAVIAIFGAFSIYALVRYIVQILRTTKMAFALGLQVKGIGWSTLKFSGTKLDHNVLYTIHRKKSGYVAGTMELVVDAKFPYVVTFKQNHIGGAAQNLEDAWEIDAWDSAAIQPLITHPVVESILLEIGSKSSNSHLQIGLAGIWYQQMIPEDATAEYVWRISEPVMQLALYLSQPDCLKPVASVEQARAALSRAIAGKAEKVIIDPARNDTTEVTETGIVAEEQES